MPQVKQSNRRIVLASRPQGLPTPANFRLEHGAVPELGQGQVLLRSVFLSLDPYMRGRMSEAPSYAPPVAVGDVMVGGVVGRIEASRHPDYAVNEWVMSQVGWQDYGLSDGTGLLRLGTSVPHPSWALGVLGMPGFTAYMGLLDIGAPKAGETVVVAAATGAVGSVVGQIAKLKGCRVVGIAGGVGKCHYAVEGLGFDACVDHRDPAFPRLLAAACPEGIDVDFENVGGAVFDAVLPLLNRGARVCLCGLIAQYNATSPPPGPDRSPLLLETLLKRRIRMQGFIIFEDYAPRFGEFVQQMTAWLAEGRIRYREDLIEGLENAPLAFIGLFEGRNLGKRVVRVGPN